MSKIKEIIIEPTKIYTTETFRMKIAVNKYVTFGALKKAKVEDLKVHTIKELRGEV